MGVSDVVMDVLDWPLIVDDVGGSGDFTGFVEDFLVSG